MTNPYFIETIKVLDGKFLNLPFHMERMNRTMIHFFNTTMFVELWIGDIPEDLRIGLVKCRITYSYTDVKVEYERYNFRHINSLKLVEGNTINYSFKYADRSLFSPLLLQKGYCEDILITKSGLITDTSYSNVVFEDSTGLYTPSTYLLNGTKRQLLLQQGKVYEADICVQDLAKYSKLYLINAMIDIEDNICIDISDII